MIAARCLFCGAIGEPWWSCNCVAAQEVRAGKRAKPRVIRRGGETIIEIDLETIAKNPLGLKRYVPPGGKTGHPDALAQLGRKIAQMGLETAHSGETAQETAQAPAETAQADPEAGKRERKRRLILAKLLIAPQLSDRQIAQEFGVSHHTVAAVRRGIKR